MTEITEANSARDVQAGKWKLHYNEAGTGQAVIFLHGSGPGATGWSNFSANIAPLSKKYRVIAMDAPGWGGSDPIDATKVEFAGAQAEAVKLLMDTLDIKKAALVGNSGGGGTAIQFATMWPDRISHLITMGSGLYAPGSTIFTPSGMSEGMNILLETYRDPSPANFERLVSIMVYDSSFVTKELCELRSRASLEKPEHLANFLKRASPDAIPGKPWHEVAAKLGEFEGPCLFIHGRDDRVVPFELTLRLLSMTKNSQAHIFNRCGHWCQIEHADAFNSLVDSFIESQAGRD